MYIYLYLCVNLQISVICYLYYDVQWFCFWGCGLSVERVVAYPLQLSLFSPRCLWLYVRVFMAIYAQLCGCISVNGNMYKMILEFR